MSSSVDPRDAYTQAVAVLDAARKKAEDVVQRITDGAKALRQWRDVQITNVSFHGSGNTNAPSIDGFLWPTGEQLANAISAYNKAWDEAKSAFNRIPAADRKTIKPPVR